MTQTMKKASPLSAGLVNASILLYTVWLLLPAVQTTAGRPRGALAVGVFGLGVLLDAAYLKKRWAWLLLRACCAAAMPLVLWFFLSRGGGNFAGFYVQQAMFWFPLVFCAYARERGDGRMWRWLKPLLLAVMVATTLTTVGWLVEGMLRGGRVYAYSRSLGSGEPGREAYLKELMLRNIGGYDFVYATVLSLPLTCIGVQRARGWRRAGYAAFLGAQVVMIVLSQYTYAMVFAAAILAVELTALAVRAVSRGRVKMGASLLWGLVPVVAVYLLRFPLVTLAADICEGLGLSNLCVQLSAAPAGAGGRRDGRGFASGALPAGAGRLARLAACGLNVRRRKAAQPAQRYPGPTVRHGIIGDGGCWDNAVGYGARVRARPSRQRGAPSAAGDVCGAGGNGAAGDRRLQPGYHAGICHGPDAGAGGQTG